MGSAILAFLLSGVVFETPLCDELLEFFFFSGSCFGVFYSEGRELFPFFTCLVRLELCSQIFLLLGLLAGKNSLENKEIVLTNSYFLGKKSYVEKVSFKPVQCVCHVSYFNCHVSYRHVSYPIIWKWEWIHFSFVWYFNPILSKAENMHYHDSNPSDSKVIKTSYLNMVTDMTVKLQFLTRFYEPSNPSDLQKPLWIGRLINEF